MFIQSLSETTYSLESTFWTSFLRDSCFEFNASATFWTDNLTALIQAFSLQLVLQNKEMEPGQRKIFVLQEQLWKTARHLDGMWQLNHHDEDDTFGAIESLAFLTNESELTQHVIQEEYILGFN